MKLAILLIHDDAQTSSGLEHITDTKMIVAHDYPDTLRKKFLFICITLPVLTTCPNT
tara:strand:- start:907 stop:1077 length:171 start_codon:yes stop_codon:yes gene_type:complete